MFFIDFHFVYLSCQLMALLLLRHALTIPDEDGDDDASAYFSVSRTLTHSLPASTSF